MWRDGGIAFLLATACFLIASAEDPYIGKRKLNVTVPRWVQNGTKGVLLDCEYEYDLNEENFVLKWFLNNDTTAVYQWIPSKNARVFSTLFGKEVNWEHTLEGSDKFNKYRQILLKQPDRRFSGTYHCSVNSRNSHGMAAARMDIYSFAKNVTLIYSDAPDNQVNVSCIVEKILPKPDIQLFMISSDSDTPEPITLTFAYIKDNGIHGYDIAVSALLTTAELNSSGNTTTLQCVVQIQGLDYEEIRTKQYNLQSEMATSESIRDNHENHSSCPTFSLASLICIIIAILVL